MADLAELQRLLAGSRPPPGHEREDRVRLIGEAAQALLAGRMPEDQARVFLAGACAAWLENGGDLERDYFRVTKAKSHRTPAAIWRELRAHRDERRPSEPCGTLAASTNRKEIAE